MSIERLRKDAKKLKTAYDGGEEGARARFRRWFTDPPGVPVPLATAQLVVARDEGYRSWPGMVRSRDDRVQSDLSRHAVAGDVDGLRDLLRTYQPWSRLLPSVTFNRPHDPDRTATCVRLLLDAGCDPDAGVMLRGEKLPNLWGCIEHDAVASAKVLLAAGADPRNAAVQRRAAEAGGVWPTLLSPSSRHDPSTCDGM